MSILIPPLVLGGTGLILGILIYFVSKFFGVQEDRRVEEVEHLLPNYNCGACGYPGCHGLAIAILSGDCDATKCKPIKKEEVEILNRYLDSLKEGQPMTHEMK